MICLRDKSFCIIESKEQVAKSLGQDWEHEKLIPSIIWLRSNAKPDLVLGRKEIYNLTGGRLSYDNLKNFKTYTQGVEGFWNDFIIVKDSERSIRVYFVLHFGANGPGNWTKKDLKDAKKEYEKMIANGAEDVSFTMAQRDLADDVTDWGTTFTI